MVCHPESPPEPSPVAEAVIRLVLFRGPALRLRSLLHGLKFTIEEMSGSDRSRPLDYARAAVVKV